VITFDNSSRPRPLCDGAGAPFACGSGNIYGGKTPAQTWFGTMAPLLEGQPVIPLPPTEERYVAGGAQTRVPDVVGRGQNDARGVLEKAGWRVSTLTVDNAAPRGTVVAQTPKDKALPGEQIVLSISSGTAPPQGDDGGGGDNGGGGGGGD
jgi:membrane peptidoglycan carboxypeptidase